MQVQRVVRSCFAVVVLSLIVALIDLSAAHARPAPTPPPQCSSAPCGGSCTIFPPCTPGPNTACPDYVLLGECKADAVGACQCVPVQPSTPTPAPIPTLNECNPTANNCPAGKECNCCCGTWVCMPPYLPCCALPCSAPTPLPTPTATPTPCVDTVLCIIGFHWSPEQCQCVPDQPRHPHAPHSPRGPQAVHVPHAPHSPRGSAAQGCSDSGGTVTSALCCGSASDFPNTCLIGACGCAPDASHEVRVCECGDTRCFDGVTCTGTR